MMILPKLIRMLAGAALLLVLLPACTSTPIRDRSDGISGLQQERAQDALFEHGKALFVDKQYGPAAAALLPLAKQGHIGAQYTIGYMYHYGYGVPRNEKESVRWIAIAAGRGHKQAKEALTRINASHDQRGVISVP